MESPKLSARPRPCPTTRGWLLILAASALLGTATEPASSEPPLLAPGATIERELAAGEAHGYRVDADGRRPFLLVAEQDGVDVEIEVEVEAEGGASFVADGPFDRRGREVVLLAGAAGYRVTVRGREAGAPPGRYALRLEPLADGAALEDNLRLDAARAETAAARLYPRGTVAAWREAIGHHRRAFERWRSLGEDAAAARSLYARAVLHRLVDAPRDGLESARGAADLFRRLGDPLAEGYAANELGLDHWRLGGLDDARRGFERARELGEAAGDPFLVAAAASNLCLMELSRGELLAGRACYERSLPAIEAARSAEIESAARTNLGRLAEHLGEPEEALGHYRRALDTLAGAGNRRGQAQTLNNLGVLLRGVGELEDAMARYAEALAIFEELGERRWQARVLLNVGYAYRSLSEPGRALVSFERALHLFRQVEDHRGEATALDHLGLVQRDLGHPEEAPELHRRALELRRRGGDRQGEAVTLRRLGEALAELGEGDAARARFGESVALAAEIGDGPGEAETRRELGQLHLERGEIEAARRELETALDLAVDAAQRPSEAEILVDLAEVERAAGRTEQARRRLAAALERLEELRARIASPELRTASSSLRRRADALDVDLAMAAHRADPAAGHHRRALEAAERARAQTLLELLQEADVDLGTGVDPALLERRRSLARRLDAKAERLADPGLDDPSRTTLEAEQLALLQRLELLYGEIRRRSPAYGEIARPRPLSAREIQALVDPGTTLAVYLLGEPASWLWRVTPEAIDAFELPGRSEIEAAVRRVHESWRELDVAARARDHAAAEELAEMLRLGELLGPRRLAVIADGALHLLPFAALPVPGDHPGAPPVPLVTRAEVVALPSASVLALDRRLHAGTDSARNTVAVVADPPAGPDYPRLPESRREAETVAALAPGESLVAVGADASRELVESGRLSHYGVVHFATHGVIDTENPALSALVLGRVDPGGREQSDLLRLHDVYHLRLDAELVVLSGCRTALGPVVRGEGLIGLARGFLYAGARRVLASLWRVEDRATAELMASFYRALWDRGLPPSAALAEAQRELSQTRRFRDPYHWAGFVLVGDWR